MADTKITALTADTSPTSDDLIVTVTDPAGTPANRKVTLADAVTKAHGLSDTTVIGVASGVLAAAATTGTGSVVRATSPTLVTPALGTPASGTLTNCTGLPLAGVVDSTTEALGVGSLEVGHASDSTITRVSAGTLAIEGQNILTAATGQPLDSDLTTIAGLTATTDNFIQAKSSAWASRTPTQVTADLIAFVGDSGSGGTKGLVPAPATGDAAANKFLKADGTWTAPTGSGDVVGPASATDNAITRFDGTTGKLIQNSVVTVADTTGNIAGPQKITLGAAASATGSIELVGTTSGTVTVKPADAAGTWTLTLPNSGGTNNYVLSTNGAGVTSWVAQSGGGLTLGLANAVAQGVYNS